MPRRTVAAVQSLTVWEVEPLFHMDGHAQNLTQKLTDPIKWIFWQSRPEKCEEAKNKNASSLGLFLADRTRGASSDPPAPSHFSSLADGHLEFIFQSAARTGGIRRHHTLHIAQS